MKPLETYLGALTVTQGRRAGEALTVLPWQRKFIAGAFTPGRTTAALSVARGNGKTVLVAGIACAALDGPLMVPRGETIIVASSFAQACIAFDHVVAFMGDKLRERKRYRFWQTGQLAKIEDKETGTSVRALGSDPKRPFRKGLSGRCRCDSKEVAETDMEPPCGRRPPESSIAARRCVIRLI